MTPERAQEILRQTNATLIGAMSANYRKHMTDDETNEVLRLWDTLPGWTSFNTALCVLACPNPPETINTHSELQAALVKVAQDHA